MRLIFKSMIAAIAMVVLLLVPPHMYAQATYLPGGYWTLDSPLMSSLSGPYYNSVITPPSLRLYPHGHTVTGPGTVSRYLKIDETPLDVPTIYHTNLIASKCFLTLETVFRVDGPKRSGMLMHWQYRFYVSLSEMGLEFTVMLDSGLIDTSLKVPFDGIGRRSPEYWFDHQWHHLVVMYNCCTGFVEVYIDGESPDGFSKLLSPDVTAPGDTSMLALGGPVAEASFANDEARFVGLCLDEIAIYSQSIPPTLIYQHYLEAINDSVHYDFTDTTPFSSLPPPGWVYGGGRPATTEWDFPPMTGSPLTLLRDCPGPRYRPGADIHHLYPWVADPELLGKVGGTPDGVLAADILLELAQHYHYHLLLGNLKDADSASLATSGTFVNRMLSHVNTYSSIPRFAITNWANAQGGNPNLYTDPDTSYYIRDNTLSGDPRYTPNRWRWSKRTSSTAMTLLKNDGFWFTQFVDNWFAVMGTDRIDALSENGEVHIPWSTFNPIVFTKDAVLNADYTSSGLGSHIEYESMAANTFNHEYIDSLLIYIHSLSSTNPELLWYNIGGDVSNIWVYDRVRTINRYTDAWTRPTPYLYPQTPAGWRHHTASLAGWNRLVNGFTKEVEAGDSLMNPFVSPGFDDNLPGGDFHVDDAERIRPGQYLGLLKGVMVLGADVFTPFVYNPASGEDGKQVLYHLTIPSYVQSLVTHCGSFLWNSRVLWGNNLITTGIPEPDYTFTTGYTNDLIVARKDDTANRFLITGSVQKMSNLPGSSDLSKIVTFNLSDAEYSSFTPFDLTLRIREQGSTYLLDESNPSQPLMIQLDGWHEWKSPEYWCKNYSIEAELSDSLPGDYELRTERPFGAGIHDYSSFTTWLHNTDGTPSPVRYSFLQRNQDTLYVFVRARRRNKTSSSYDVKVSTDVGGSIGVLSFTSTDWEYQYIPAIAFGISDTQQVHWVEIKPDSSVDVDLVYLGLRPTTPDVHQVAATVDEDTICLNDTAVFRTSGWVAGCATATWYFGDGDSLTGGNIAHDGYGSPTDIVMHRYRHPGTYVVTVRIWESCTDTVFLETFTITIQGSKGSAGPDRFVCAGGSVQMAASAGPGTAYFWSPDPELSDTSVLNPWVVTTSTSVSHMMYLHLTDSLCGSTLTDSAWVFVKKPALFSPPDTFLRACTLDSTVLSLPFETDSVVWMPSSLFNDNTLIHPTVGPVSDTTVLTCYVWDPCGCTVDTIEVTLIPNEFECCPVPNADFEWKDVRLSMLGLSSVTNSRIHIRGTLYMDMGIIPFPFDFSRNEVFLDKDASIVIDSVAYIQSNGNYYQAACRDCMWEGIVVDSITSFFWSTNDTIQDAKVAIQNTRNGRIQCDSTRFDMNHVGIMALQNYHASYLSINNCDFTTSDYTLMKCPYDSTYGEVGIWIREGSMLLEIPLSVSVLKGSDFSNLYSGIRCDSTEVKLRDCQFDLMQPRPSAAPYTSGVGILATGTGTELLVVDKCSFTKSDYGSITRAYDSLRCSHSVFQRLNTGSVLFSTHGLYKSNVFDGMVGTGFLTDYLEGAGILAMSGGKTLTIGGDSAGNKFMSSDVGVICKNYAALTCISDTFRSLQTGVYLRKGNGTFTSNIFTDISASGIPVVNYTAGAGILAVDTIFGGHVLRVTDSLGANFFKNSQTGIACSKFGNLIVEGDSITGVETGIFMLNTTGSFYENRFREIASSTSMTSPFEGGAIIARNSSLSSVFSLTVGDTLSPNLFIQNQKGVIVTGPINTQVVGNPFDDHGLVSIWLRNTTYLPGSVSPVRTIRSNTISNSPVGIWLTSLGKNVIRVSRNVITGDSLKFRTGIRLDNVTYTPGPVATDFTIQGNNIQLFGNGTHLNGVINMMVSGNSIKTLWPGTTVHPYMNGIFITGSFTRNFIQNNQITGANDDIITAVDSFMHGISLWGCIGAVIFNNKIDTVGWHMVARGMTNANILYCNEMTRGISGMVIAGTGRFGNIGNASTGTGYNNKWAVGTFTGQRCNESAATGTPQNIFVKTSPPNQNPGIPPSPWTRTIVSNNINCPTDPPTGGDGSSGTLLADRINQYQSTWDQISANDSVAGIAKWVNLFGMYADISEDDSLYADSAMQVIHSTIDTLSSISYLDEYGNPVVVPVNISDFARLDQAFTQSDTATADSLINLLTTVLDPATAYMPELKLLEAFTLQYQTIFAGNDTLSDDQYDDVYALATQCPDVYGLAPFKAQAILAGFGVLDLFNGCSGSNKWSEPESQDDKIGAGNFVVYPNPTTGELNFILPESVQAGRLTLTDLVGHELLHLPVSGTNVTLDLSGLAAGVYIYKLEDSISGVHTGQVVLIKEE